MLASSGLGSRAQNTLVLPEGTEERTIIAAAKIIADKIASKVTLLGNIDKIKEVAAANNVDLAGIDLIDPENSEWNAEFAAEYYELRKKKGMTEEQAAIDIKHFLRFGAMMVRLGKADAMVAGALSSTADVLRAGLTIIGTAPGMKTASYKNSFKRSYSDSLIFLIIKFIFICLLYNPQEPAQFQNVLCRAGYP